MTFEIRSANLEHVETIADFNRRLAEETESKVLDLKTVRLGVSNLIENAHRGRYFVACDQDRVIGQLMITTEWSDWRNGEIWWIQSVYVHRDYRRRGVFRALFEHIKRLATETPQIVAIRLYVERENTVARKVYESLGLCEPGYLVMECPLANRSGD